MLAKVPRIYVIGGAPRAGKDTATGIFLQQNPDVTLLSIDDEIRRALWGKWRLHIAARLAELVGRQTLARQLFQEPFDGARYQTDDEWFPNILDKRLPDGTSYFLERHDRQHTAVWQLGNTRKRIQTQAQQAGSLLVQGVAIRPAYAQELIDDGNSVRAVYLGNENPDFADTMIEIVHQAKRENPNSNWMALRDWSDERIRRYMARARELSTRRREEAGAYNFPYFDMGDGNFQENVGRVVGYLATGELE